MTGRPLAGIKVLDLTQFLAGPYCTQILGDLGAEVVKVEWPEGDPTRAVAPHFIGDDSAYFAACNRNKRSIAIDLKLPQGRALLQRLALASDIVAENYRPGVVQRLGLDYDALAKEKPGLIWCSISGFGQDGPYRDRPAFDMIVQALSGGMSLTGEIGGAPVRSGLPLGDLCAGMYGAIGVLAALEERHRTGKGKFVDIAMLDCQIAMLNYQAAYHLNAGVSPSRQGRGHDLIPTYRAFTAGDGIDVLITANTAKNWLDLCAVLEEPSLPDDPRFRTGQDRLMNREALWALLEAAFKKRPAEDWIVLLQKAEIPCGVVNTVDRALKDPQVLHRNMVIDLDGPPGLSARVPGDPIKFRDAPEEHHRFPPLTGADTRAVLAEMLELNAAEIDALVDEQIVFTKARKTPGRVV
jgi:CoA:oxalate CoA-transferase